MSNQWLRLWHDMPNDPKWRTIARLSGQRISLVQSIWLHILVSASEAKERGTYTIAEESISSALDESEENVIAIISAMQGRVLTGKQVINWERRQPNRDEGGNLVNYIYYVGATNGDVVKIGISKNPWARIKDMQTGSPVKYEILATLKTGERSEIEIHKFFKQTRTKGEWFRRSKALNLLIENITSKVISTHEEALEFLSSLPSADYFPITVVANVATKDKEEIREDKKEVSKLLVATSAPTSELPLKEIKAKRKTRLPDDWELPQEWGDWAESEGLSGDEIIKEAEKFKDRQKSIGAAYSDWQATWRNWIRNYIAWRAKDGLQAKR